MSAIRDLRAILAQGRISRLSSNVGGVVPMFASYLAHSDKVAHLEQAGVNWTTDGIHTVESWWLA